MLTEPGLGGLIAVECSARSRPPGQRQLVPSSSPSSVPHSVPCARGALGGGWALEGAAGVPSGAGEPRRRPQLAEVCRVPGSATNLRARGADLLSSVTGVYLGGSAFHLSLASPHHWETGCMCQAWALWVV